MTIGSAMLGFITHRDQRLMRRVNRWPAPRWIRLWMIAARYIQADCQPQRLHLRVTYLVQPTIKCARVLAR